MLLLWSKRVFHFTPTTFQWPTRPCIIWSPPSCLRSHPNHSPPHHGSSITHCLAVSQTCKIHTAPGSLHMLLLPEKFPLYPAPIICLTYTPSNLFSNTTISENPFLITGHKIARFPSYTWHCLPLLTPLYKPEQLYIYTLSTSTLDLSSKKAGSCWSLDPSSRKAGSCWFYLLLYPHCLE